jgi:hypothetical protein
MAAPPPSVQDYRLPAAGNGALAGGGALVADDEREILPRLVRAAAVRWTWAGLVVILLALAWVAAAISAATGAVR